MYFVKNVPFSLFAPNLNKHFQLVKKKKQDKCVLLSLSIFASVVAVFFQQAFFKPLHLLPFTG